MDHTNQPREPTAETRSVAAKKFYLVAELVDLDAEAVELDLVLPVVTGRHGVGEDWATGLDEPQEHAQFLKEPRLCAVLLFRRSYDCRFPAIIVSVELLSQSEKLDHGTIYLSRSNALVTGNLQAEGITTLAFGFSLDLVAELFRLERILLPLGDSVEVNPMVHITYRFEGVSMFHECC